MYKINDNYLKLPGSYLFSTIAKKVAAYSSANPDKEIIKLGIGDVTIRLPYVIRYIRYMWTRMQWQAVPVLMILRRRNGRM